MSTSATYNLDLPLSNSAAVNASVVADPLRRAESELKFIDTKATTELGSLPGGPIGLALGAEYREEELIDVPDPLSLSGEILGSGNTQTNASRENFAAYAEFAFPLTRQLEVQAALRFDDYSDFGNTTNPKLGLKFKPTPEVLLRANWGRGFRAPSLVEITPSRAFTFQTVNDPANNLTGVQVSGFFAGNPDLEPEKSRSTTVGIVWEPNSSFNVSFDVYDISWSNIVNAPSFQSLVNANDPAVVIRLPPTPQFPGGQIVTVLNGFINVNRTETRGVDIDTRYIARTDFESLHHPVEYDLCGEVRRRRRRQRRSQRRHGHSSALEGLLIARLGPGALDRIRASQLHRLLLRGPPGGIFLHGAGPALPDRLVPDQGAVVYDRRYIRPLQHYAQSLGGGLGAQRIR